MFMGVSNIVAKMLLSNQRIEELSRGYLAHLQRHPSNHTAPPHAITNPELRKLRTWIALFSMNPAMQDQLLAYVRNRGRTARSKRMRQTYEGYMSGVDAVTDERVLVCCPTIRRNVLLTSSNIGKSTSSTPRLRISIQDLTYRPLGIRLSPASRR
jgi:hypothetical protein